MIRRAEALEARPCRRSMSASTREHRGPYLRRYYGRGSNQTARASARRHKSDSIQAYVQHTDTAQQHRAAIDEHHGDAARARELASARELPGCAHHPQRPGAPRSTMLPARSVAFGRDVVIDVLAEFSQYSTRGQPFCM